MADLEQVKAEWKRLYLAGDKDELVRYAESLQDELTNEEGEEFARWRNQLVPAMVTNKAGETERTLFDAAAIEAMSGSPGIPEHERQGVYVHSFKCFCCGLHFQTFSWQANRHSVGTIACPECGDRERLVHWRATVNQCKTFRSGGTEIHNLFPHPDSSQMADSWEGPP